MKVPPEEYLGDGCYVSFDGWQICLRAPRENGDHVVYLEPKLLHNLIRYVCRLGMELPQRRESKRND